jgi:hypothetical protein
VLSGLPSPKPEACKLQGSTQSVPEVLEVVGSKGSLQISKVLLQASPQDKEAVLMGQIDQFLQQAFLLGNLCLQEQSPASPGRSL